MLDILSLDEPGKSVLFMTNEAIARGAIESGVRFVAAYPGTPATEINENLVSRADKFGYYAEWTINEKVAIESAAGASFAGYRSIVSMKHAGFNWTMDFISNFSCHDFGGGFLIVVADDPGAHSSGNEQDTRPLAKFCHLPAFSPSFPQEAKEMTNYAFELSEEFKHPTLLRSSTLMSHSKGNVVLGEIREINKGLKYDKSIVRVPWPFVERHRSVHGKIEEIRERFENSRFNTYEGPMEAEFKIITTGTGYLYLKDVINILGLEDKVGILKLGTVYPLPEELIKRHLKKSKRVLFVEEVDPYLEEEIKSISTDLDRADIPRFYGKKTGHIPSIGELDPNQILLTIESLTSSQYSSPVSSEYTKKTDKFSEIIPPRGIVLCAGCPHRATYYCAQHAVEKNGGKGLCLGDVGCNTFGALPPFSVLVTGGNMGGGPGMASGLGQIMDEPVLNFIGDSTFFHSCTPALINISHAQSNVTTVVLDNLVTGSTGFQPHPGSDYSGTSAKVKKIVIEDVLRGIGISDIDILDPFSMDFNDIIDIFVKHMNMEGPSAIIARRVCAIEGDRIKRREGGVKNIYEVDPDLCTGCKICLTEFSCPGTVWVEDGEKVAIDEVFCNGCGACIQICPTEAIVKKGETNVI